MPHPYFLVALSPPVHAGASSCRRLHLCLRGFSGCSSMLGPGLRQLRGMCYTLGLSPSCSHNPPAHSCTLCGFLPSFPVPLKYSSTNTSWHHIPKTLFIPKSSSQGHLLDEPNLRHMSLVTVRVSPFHGPQSRLPQMGMTIFWTLVRCPSDDNIPF